MGKAEAAVSWMERIAEDDSHGYSQANRWGPDYDCSSMIIEAWERAGVPVKSKGATYTGNMFSVFRTCGFKDVTSEIYLPSGTGLIRGDVLLNHSDHTAMYIGGGRVVHARSSEGNSQPGDQSGNEIRCQSYWNYPWNCVLRYPDNESTSTDVTETAEVQALQALSSCRLCNGCVGDAVTALQAILNYYFGSYKLDIDSEFGPLTEAAVREFQHEFGLAADGIVGPQTWHTLLEGKQ